MQSDTVIIMIVGLIAIGLIRLVIAMVGREFSADHPHVKSSAASGDDGTESVPVVPSQRPMRGTGKKSHLLYFPPTDESAAEVPEPSEVKAEPTAS